jgi:hypothetical protein
LFFIAAKKMKDFFIIKSDIVDVVVGNKNLATIVRAQKQQACGTEYYSLFCVSNLQEWREIYTIWAIKPY